jgi:PhnB protein
VDELTHERLGRQDTRTFTLSDAGDPCRGRLERSYDRMQLEPYLFFHGRCEEALNFYKECLRGEIIGINRFAGSPMEENVGAEYGDKVMHASFIAGDVKFMASDGRPGSPPDGDDDIALSLATSDAAEGERVFNALAEGGEVTMPLEEAFWGGRFGSLTDRFGVQWMVSVHP